MPARNSLRALAAGLAAAALLPIPASVAAPGDRYEIRSQDLPPPYASRSASNGPQVVPRPPGATLAVPAGFAVNLFADGLDNPREFEVLPNGDVLVAETQPGRIVLLRDSDGDGTAETRETFARGYEQPFGIALQGSLLHIADQRGVWRLPYLPGATSAAEAVRITPSGAFGRPGGHSTRNIVFHPDGGRFYVSIGSAGNVGEEAAPRATIQEFAADGSGQRTFGSGLRNPVGIAFRPGTDELYTVVNERDGLGDQLVPDYLTQVADGAFFGWPYAYAGQHPQPDLAARRPDLVAISRVPDVLFESHSAPIGLAFYDGAMFPAEYRGDAFVAHRGSWNRADPVGYKIVRVPFDEAGPPGWYEDFATGFRVGGSGRAAVWGRPAGLAVAADGALLIADDTSGAIWRISYRGP